MNNKQQQQYCMQQGDSPYCCFHPRELVVGVCAHCLKDRLLLLLLAANAKQDANPALLRRSRRSRNRTSSRGSSISLPKVFALGSSFLLQRLDSRHYHHRPDHADADTAAPPPAKAKENNYSDDDTTSVASLDDSFISIKFEDNGKATWDSHSNKQKQVVVATKQQAPVRSSTVVVAEHAKRGGVTRWRKQVVGRLLQLARWRRSAAACHVGLDGKKVAAAEQQRSKAGSGRGRAGAGWIRSLTITRRRAAAAHGDRAWS